MERYDKINDAPDAIGPYSIAVEHAGVLYVSGQIPIDPKTGEVVSSDVVEQTKQVMENIHAILSAQNLTFNHVIKCSIFIRNMGDFQKINDVYGSYFSEGNYPARETVEVSCLPKSVDVEISCLAAVL